MPNQSTTRDTARPPNDSPMTWMDCGRGTLAKLWQPHTMLADLGANCTVLAGCEDYVLGDPPVEGRPPSQLTNSDLAALQVLGRRVLVPSRIEDAGHCLLLDNPRACVAALSGLLAG